jgi:hypothetical protein
VDLAGDLTMRPKEGIVVTNPQPNAQPAPTEPATTADAEAVTEALAQAATAAGYAPSIHNTQPWRWELADHTLDLYLQHGRVLAVTDPDARLAMLSCGAALHHARVGLAAQGWGVTVTRLPDPTDEQHLAHLAVDGRVPVEPTAVRRAQTIRLRHTDRRPVTGPPVPPEALATIATAVAGEGVQLHVLQPDQVLDLASAADYAQRTESAEAAWQAELAYWTGGTRPSGTGVPDAAIPEAAPRTTVPGRDFGHHGELPISSEHDRTAATTTPPVGCAAAKGCRPRG